MKAQRIGFSGLADCAGLGSQYTSDPQSTYRRRLKAEGQIRCNPLLGRPFLELLSAIIL